jgi:hypothetical protein
MYDAPPGLCRNHCSVLETADGWRALRLRAPPLQSPLNAMPPEASCDLAGDGRKLRGCCQAGPDQGG